MQLLSQTDNDQAPSGLTTHPITPEDRAAMAALRAVVVPNKGKLQGTAAREPFDAIAARVTPPAGVEYAAGAVGGVSGWWCRPTETQSDRVILHLHGGWFNWGSAGAFRHLVGHIATRAGAQAFIPDYRLAPEHPFPAAVDDARACYDGVTSAGFRRVAVTGDSAGGGLALLLLSLATASAAAGTVVPVGAVVLSPVTDLALTGPSWETRAAADPYFTRPQAAGLIHSYLAGHSPADPLASPLYGDLTGLPPVRVHVGEDEVLLDDSRRYVELAAAAGVDARVDVWEGMPHGFVSGVGRLAAASHALDAIGTFLRERLATAAT